jgi:hypothetical protein
MWYMEHLAVSALGAALVLVVDLISSKDCKTLVADLISLAAGKVLRWCFMGGLGDLHLALLGDINLTECSGR